MFELEHLTIGYAKRQVITDLSLKIPEQTILAILGPSGSGKTTLLNAIADLLPHSGGISLMVKRSHLSKPPSHWCPKIMAYYLGSVSDKTSN